MSITQDTSPSGRHAGAPVEVDAEIEYLNQAGLAAGLPAGLGDSQSLVVMGAHRADLPEETGLEQLMGAHQATIPAPRHALTTRLVLTGALAVMVVLMLAFVALQTISRAWPTAGGAA